MIIKRYRNGVLISEDDVNKKPSQLPPQPPSQPIINQPKPNQPLRPKKGCGCGKKHK